MNAQATLDHRVHTAIELVLPDKDPWEADVFRVVKNGAPKAMREAGPDPEAISKAILALTKQVYGRYVSYDPSTLSH